MSVSRLACGGCRHLKQTRCQNDRVWAASHGRADVKDNDCEPKSVTRPACSLVRMAFVTADKDPRSGAQTITMSDNTVAEHMLYPSGRWKKENTCSSKLKQ